VNDGDGAVEQGGTGQGAGQVQGVLAYRLGGFGQAAIRVAPAAGQEQPVLDDHGQEFGIDLREHPPGLAATGLVDLAVTLPELEEQFNLPAGAGEDEGLAQGELLGGEVGDEDGPLTPGQAGRAGGAAAVARCRAQATAALVGDLLWDTHSEQAGAQVLDHAQRDGQIDLRRPLGGEQGQDIPPLAWRVIDRRGAVQPRQPVAVGGAEVGQDVQIEEAQIGQAQRAFGQGRVLDGRGALMSAPIEEQRPDQLTPAEIIAHPALEGSAGVHCCAPAAARPPRPQRVGQHKGGAIQQHHRAEALQQRDRHRVGRHHRLHRRPQQRLEEHRRRFGAALVQPLRADGHAHRRGRLGQVLPAGVRVGQPAEDQRLREQRPAHLRLPLHKARAPRQRVGRGGQQRLQRLRHLWYRSHSGASFDSTRSCTSLSCQRSAPGSSLP